MEEGEALKEHAKLLISRFMGTYLLAELIFFFPDFKIP